MSAPTAGTWRVTASSQRGSSHRDGTPNQDAVGSAELLDRARRQVIISAVADGHGGSSYVRSEVGASFAVRISLDRLRDAVPSDESAPGLDEMLRRETPAIVGAWRAAVLRHAASHPFTSEELARGGGQLHTAPVLAYGSTLILALICHTGIALAQLGDGDALVRREGAAARPVPVDPRLVGGETTSLCLDSAVADFRFASVPAATGPDLVLLCTDGYGNSFGSSDWWRVLVDDVAGFASTHGFEAVGERLPAWLAESARVGGDDVSAVLMVRTPLAHEPAGTRL